MFDVRIVLVILLNLVAILLFMLAVLAWQKSQVSGSPALYLAVCLISGGVYNFMYAREIASNTLPEMMIWVRLEAAAFQFLVPAWTLFSLALGGKEKWITPRFILLLCIVPAWSLVLSQTLGTLNLAHPNPHLDLSGPFPTFAYDKNILYNGVGLVYDSVCLGTSTWLFSKSLWRSNPTFRSQALIYLGGSLVLWLTGILYNFGLVPSHFDPTSLAFSFSAVLFSLGFFRLGVLDIVPLARDVIFEGMRDGVLVLDTNDRIIDVNQSLKETLPAAPKKLIGLPVYLALASYPELLKIIAENGTKSPEIQTEIMVNQHFYQVQITPFYKNRNTLAGRIIVLNNHTQVHTLLKHFETLAAYDGLTGVYNRRFILEAASERISQIQQTGGTLALIMADIDHFKKFNDTYGHAAGDEVLKSTAELWKGMLRQTDMLGRLGGEEFVILLWGCDLTMAAAIAERFRAALAEQVLIYEQQTLKVQASFGVTWAKFPANITLTQLLRLADDATYLAKIEGRNRVCTLLPTDQP